MLGVQVAAAEHGTERDGNQPGNQHRGNNHHSKFVEKAAQNSRHEKDRNKDHGQRHRHRKNGKSDFLGALKRGLKRRLSHFDVPHDVFEHDDGVINHKTHRKRQGEQRQIVNRVVQQVHHRKRAHDRQGESHAGDQGGRSLAQKQEDDQNHQQDGKQKSELDVAHRIMNRNGAVVFNRQINRGRHHRVEVRQQLSDVPDNVDGVGSGLAVNGQDDAGNTVDPVGDVLILNAVGDPGHLIQLDGSPVAVGDNQRAVDGGIGKLAVGLKVIGLVRPVESAQRHVDVGVFNGLLNLVDADLPAGEFLGVQMHAHGVLGGAVDINLRHAGNHGNLLGDKIFRIPVDFIKRQGRRGHSQHKNGPVSGIHLSKGRRERHVRRKLISRG